MDTNTPIDTAQDPAGLDFSSILSHLEKLVNRLEEGQLSLEDAILTFERGIVLASEGKRRLELAEKRVSILLDSTEGETLAPFATREDS